MNLESLKARIYDFEVALDGLKQELKKLEEENKKEQELEKQEEKENVSSLEQISNESKVVENSQQEVNEEQLPQKVVSEINEEEKENTVITPIPPVESTQSEVALTPTEVTPLVPTETTNTVVNSQQEFSKIDANNARGIILNASQASNTRNNGIKEKEDVDKQLEVMFDQLSKTKDENEANLINDKIKVLQASKAA
ncbi:MAG: hypothetical protein IJ097_03255 [Bacilli bacterium]|nr:hypothetical protein [Bacilli bacterium]